MARYIVFNGITQIHPGALSMVNVDALAQVGSSINGIIGLIGEADGGEPDVFHTFDDNTTAKSTFRSGPLANAIRPCFEPANDPRVPGGAFRVKAYKVNASTQSNYVLEDAVGNDCVEITSADYGAHTSQISFEFEDDPIDADRRMMTQYSPDGVTEQITDVGDRPLMDVVYKGPDEPMLSDTITAPAAPSGGGAIILWAGADANDVGKHVVCTGSAGGAGLPAVGDTRRITAAVPGVSITVDTAFWDDTGAPVAETGGASQVYQVVVRIVAPIAASTVVQGATWTITLQDDPSAVGIPTGGRTMQAAGAGIADYALWLRVMSGPGTGQIRQVTVSANVGTAITLTTIAFDVTNAPTAAASLFGIIMVDSATGTIAGTNGVATGLTSTVLTATNFGAIGTGETENAPVDLNVTFQPALTGAKTIFDVVAEVNALQVQASQPAAGSQWESSVGVGRNGSLPSTRFDFDATNIAVALTYDVNVVQHITTSMFHRFLDNLMLVVDSYNSQSAIVTAVRSITLAGDGAGLPMTYTPPVFLAGGVRGISANSDWQDAFDDFLQTRVNIVVPLISYDLAGDGLGSTAEVSVIHQQLLSHTTTAGGAGKTERNGYASVHRTGVNALTQLLNDSSAINNKNISIVYQQPDLLDVDGNIATLDEWGMGCLVAGIQAGTAIGEPPTYKYIRATDVTQDTNLDPTDRTISNQLQLGGVLVIEPGTNDIGYRIVRALTTYLTTDNIAYTDVNVNEVINYIKYELRTAVENKFTGLKGTPARIADVKDYCSAWLEQARTDEIIVDSSDPDTGGSIHAYINLRVTLVGDIVRIVFQFYPVLGINYETIEAYAQIPIISV